MSTVNDAMLAEVVLMLQWAQATPRRARCPRHFLFPGRMEKLSPHPRHVAALLLLLLLLLLPL